jgi:hypothetical protein
LDASSSLPTFGFQLQSIFKSSITTNKVTKPWPSCLQPVPLLHPLHHGPNSNFTFKPSQAFQYTTTVPPLHHHFAATIQGFIDNNFAINSTPIP